MWRKIGISIEGTDKLPSEKFFLWNLGDQDARRWRDWPVPVDLVYPPASDGEAGELWGENVSRFPRRNGGSQHGGLLMPDPTPNSNTTAICTLYTNHEKFKFSRGERRGGGEA